MIEPKQRGRSEIVDITHVAIVIKDLILEVDHDSITSVNQAVF